jgi:DNA replication and repair protein RecF
VTLAVTSLAIRDFRNLARVELAMPRAGVVLVGPNGHGKTNFLEAIHYLHTLRSVRGARDVDLVRFGAEGFHVGARVSGAAVDEVRVGFARAAKRKRVLLDGVPCERLADAFGAVPSVMFSPRDVELVSGAPTARRRFLDIALATTSRRYLVALQRYRAALVRRNAALREAARRGDGAARVSVWEPALAEAGAVLWCERVRWTRWAAPRLAERCAAIGERERVTLTYHSSLEVPASGGDDEGVVRDALATALDRDRAHDLRRMLTHAGPHRDDLALKLGGRVMRTFASAGQQRTAAIALRLVERETLRDGVGRAPLVLLDDPFAELDVDRARRILEVLLDGGPPVSTAAGSGAGEGTESPAAGVARTDAVRAMVPPAVVGGTAGAEAAEAAAPAGAGVRARVGAVSAAAAEERSPGQVVLVVPRGDDVPPAFTALERWEIRDGALHA